MGRLLGLPVGESRVLVCWLPNMFSFVIMQVGARELAELSKINTARTLLSQFLISVNILWWPRDVGNHDVWWVLAHFLLLGYDRACLISFDRWVTRPLVWAGGSSLGDNWGSCVLNFVRLLLMSAILQTWMLVVAVRRYGTQAWPLVKGLGPIRIFPYVPKVDLPRLEGFLQLHGVILVGSWVLAVLPESVLSRLVLGLSLVSWWELWLDLGLGELVVLCLPWLPKFVGHAESKRFFLDLRGCHTIGLRRKSDLVAERNMCAGVVFSDRQNRDGLLNRRQVLLEEAKREELAVEYLFASHVLLVGAEDTDLCKLDSGIWVTGAKLTIFVVAPAVKVAVLVHRVSEILAYGKVAELRLTLNIWFYLELFEGLTIFKSPGANLVAFIEACKVVLVGAYLLDIGQRLKLVERLVLIAHVNLAARTEHYQSFFAAFHILDSLNLKGHLDLPQWFPVIVAEFSSHINLLDMLIWDHKHRAGCAAQDFLDLLSANQLFEDIHPSESINNRLRGLNHKLTICIQTWDHEELVTVLVAE